MTIEQAFVIFVITALIAGATWLIRPAGRPSCYNAATTPPNGGECPYSYCKWHCGSEPVCCSNGEFNDD